MLVNWWVPNLFITSEKLDETHYIKFDFLKAKQKIWLLSNIKFYISSKASQVKIIFFLNL